MRHVDFSPLYRSTVGFDRLFTMLDSIGQPENAQSFPPYNIERTGEDSYRISMAVAGQIRGASKLPLWCGAFRICLMIWGMAPTPTPNGWPSSAPWPCISSVFRL